MRQRPGQTKSANRVRSPGKWTRYSKVEPSGRVLGSWPKAASRWKRKVWASLFSSPLSLAANWASSRKPFSSEVMKWGATRAPRAEHGRRLRGGQGGFEQSSSVRLNGRDARGLVVCCGEYGPAERSAALSASPRGAGPATESKNLRI